MIKKKIIFHIGFRKTGTSSIQNYLAINKELLLPNISVHPRSQVTSSWRSSIFRLMRSKSVASYDEVEQEIIKASARLENNFHTKVMIISDENLIAGLAFKSTGETILDWTENIVPLIEKHFKQFSLEFVVYTRDMPKWLLSCYNQAVKNNLETRSYEDWMKCCPDGFAWQPQLGKINAQTTSPFHIIDMADEVNSDLPFGHSLLRLAGLEDEEIAALEVPARVNESVHSNALALMRLINRICISDKYKKRIKRAIEDNQELFEMSR